MRAAPVLALALALWMAALGRDGVDRLVEATVIPPLLPETSVEVVARDGRLLRAYTVADGRWRLAVGPDEVAPIFFDLLIAFEDRRFFRHPGVDPLAMARAAWQALTAGRVISGGSTLTMQVARLLEDSGTGRVGGKLRQARLALALERQLSKRQILGLYLHLAPYGGNLEGVRAASLAWFGKEPARLTPAEAALLVALPQSPEARRPDRAPEAAARGRARVLERAERLGMITPETAQAARHAPVPAGRHTFPAHAPHLADRLVGERPLAGLHRTTIDLALQERLAVLAGKALIGQGESVQIAIVVADHASGEILASVGSAAYRADARQGFVDMTRALRSPGSTLKPFVYALAFDEGLAHPETLIEDRPTAFGTYAPQNFDRKYRGTIRVREALQLSLNIPVVSLTESIGPARLMAALRRAGVSPALPSGEAGLAVALGGVGLTLEDLVQLYAALARGGVALPLRSTETSEPSIANAAMDRVVSQVAAWQTADVLAGVPPPPGAPAGAIAYKTGTSYGHRDAWAIGFDGRHVAGVWMGRPDGTPVPGAFGGELAAPVLFQAFARISPLRTPLTGPPPTALMGTTADLPQPLQRFRPRGVALFQAVDGPEVAFPPDGAEVALDGGPLLARVRGGSAPFTWLADGSPMAIAARDRAVLLPLDRAGPVALSVIDADGRAARVTVTLSP